MNTIPVGELVKQIETEIADLDKITGMKKKITKYNEIVKKIKACNEQLLTISDSKNIKTTNVNKACTDDKEYDILIKEINAAKEKITDNMEIEQLIEIYKKAMSHINKCNEFIKTKKMELIEFSG